MWAGPEAAVGSGVGREEEEAGGRAGPGRWCGGGGGAVGAWREAGANDRRHEEAVQPDEAAG